jgi:hypothetical protein
MANNYLSRDDVRPSVRPSIFTELARVKAQVEFQCLGRFIKGRDGELLTDRNGKKILQMDPMYEELCLIVAEVNLLNPESAIKVAGAEMSAFIVQEVYAKLTNEHLELVVANFKRVGTQIYNKKAYLRTALYNVVFEFHSDVKNQVTQDGWR